MIFPQTWQSHLTKPPNNRDIATFDPTLNQNDVHSWMLSQNQTQSCVDSLKKWLSDDEKNRASQFYTPQLQNRYVVRRAILRYLLGRYTQIEPAKLNFTYGRNNKPHLPDSKIHFNLSHSEDIAMIAVSRHRLGIDIEAVKSISDITLIAQRHFAPIEQTDLFSYTPDQQTAAFYHYWTLKEAFIKRDGRGLEIPLDSFAMTPYLQQPPQICFVNYDDRPAENQTVAKLPAPEGFAAALIVDITSANITTDVV